MNSLHQPAAAGRAQARAGLWAAACVLLLAPAAAAAGLHAAGAVAQQATAVKAAALTAPSKISAGEPTVCSCCAFPQPVGSLGSLGALVARLLCQPSGYSTNLTIILLHPCSRHFHGAASSQDACE
jgi:hypothetical protein